MVAHGAGRARRRCAGHRRPAGPRLARADGPAGLRGRSAAGALRDSGAYPVRSGWSPSSAAGCTILVVLAVPGRLPRRGAGARWLPLVRVLRRPRPAHRRGLRDQVRAPGAPRPAYPGRLLLPRATAQSFPSGHVANAVLMWGVARWQAVEYGLPAPVQRTFWSLSVAGPGRHRARDGRRWTSTGSPTPWSGPASGVLLLGVVHALDAVVLSRWVRARAGRQTA